MHFYITASTSLIKLPLEFFNKWFNLTAVCNEKIKKIIIKLKKTKTDKFQINRRK